MMNRFMVTLDEEESAALWDVAHRERRDPRQQAALFIRRALKRHGLLDDQGRQSAASFDQHSITIQKGDET
jgi:ABC-type sulfate transport system substrate-binding protein